ncbi:MAG: hypothetical protein QNL62_23585 [Gammaproteobacteria bacterium]|nr:hypothetical protein [Gammaproteobacteria bacterium]
MKSTLLTIGIMFTMSAGAVNAGMLTPGDTYDIRVNVGTPGGSCFVAGNCDTFSYGVTDNDLTVSGFGSGIAGDGFAAVVSITADATGDGFSVNSFNQDAYTLTFGGTLVMFANDVSGMSGTLDSAGNMTFDATGRLSLWESFPSFGIQPWNLDTSPEGDGTGTQDIWTTGTATANVLGSAPAFSMTGVPIIGSDAAGFTGQLVAAGNMGAEWDVFVGSQYSERYDLSIVNTSAPAVPVPAAVWLFGSGLLGLMGIARRRKAQA